VPSEAPAEGSPKVALSTTGMRRLDGGRFLMGSESPESWPADGEGPVREVELRPFWMDACAVTNRQFLEFVTATRYRTEAEEFGWSFVHFSQLTPHQRKTLAPFRVQGLEWWFRVDGATWRRPHGTGVDIERLKRWDHPVVHVSHRDAAAYAAWAGKRLPTEAEWEYASRGGLTGKRYPWGDELMPDKKHRCNIWQGNFPTIDRGEDGFRGTAPVRTYKPNGFGLYQMTGNVWEWVADWFSPHHPRDRVLRDPRGPATGDRRVMRGGSHLCHDSYCNRYRCSARTSNTPDSSTGHMGFRCAADAD